MSAQLWTPLDLGIRGSIWNPGGPEASNTCNLASAELLPSEFQGFMDNFVDTDGVNLGDHMPDRSGGNMWFSQGGSLEILNNSVVNKVFDQGMYHMIRSVEGGFNGDLPSLAHVAIYGSGVFFAEIKTLFNIPEQQKYMGWRIQRDEEGGPIIATPIMDITPYYPASEGATVILGECQWVKLTWGMEFGQWDIPVRFGVNDVIDSWIVNDEAWTNVDILSVELQIAISNETADTFRIGNIQFDSPF
jgi:hypothetical protein